MTPNVTTEAERTIVDMTTGRRPVDAETFDRALIAADLAPREARIRGEVFGPSAFAATVVLAQRDTDKIRRLERWTRLLAASELKVVRGASDRRGGLACLNIQALNGRRMVILTVEFAAHDEAAAVALVDVHGEHDTAVELVNKLVALHQAR